MSDSNLIYCVRCKKKTPTTDLHQAMTKNGKHMLQGKCTQCGLTKSKFISG